MWAGRVLSSIRVNGCQSVRCKRLQKNGTGIDLDLAQYKLVAQTMQKIALHCHAPFRENEKSDISLEALSTFKCTFSQYF